MPAYDNKSESMEKFSKIDHAWNIYFNTQDIIKSADQKVHVLIALTTIVTAAVITKLEILIDHGVVTRVLIVGFMIATGFFITFALSALLARYDLKADMTVPRLVFFRHIQQCSKSTDYLKYFKEISHREALGDLCNQIYEASVITQKKFKNYRLASLALLAQIILFLMMFTTSVVL